MTDPWPIARAAEYGWFDVVEPGRVEVKFNNHEDARRYAALPMMVAAIRYVLTSYPTCPWCKVDFMVGHARHAHDCDGVLAIVDAGFDPDEWDTP